MYACSRLSCMADGAEDRLNPATLASLDAAERGVVLCELIARVAREADEAVRLAHFQAVAALLQVWMSSESGAPGGLLEVDDEVHVSRWHACWYALFEAALELPREISPFVTWMGMQEACMATMTSTVSFLWLLSLTP